MFGGRNGCPGPPTQLLMSLGKKGCNSLIKYCASDRFKGFMKYAMTHNCDKRFVCLIWKFYIIAPIFSIQPFSTFLI